MYLILTWYINIFLNKIGLLLQFECADNYFNVQRKLIGISVFNKLKKCKCSCRTTFQNLILRYETVLGHNYNIHFKYVCLLGRATLLFSSTEVVP